MIKVKIVTLKGCPHCAKAKEILGKLKSEYDLSIEDIDTESSQGKELIEKYKLTTAPAFFINDKYEPDLYGTEEALRKKFDELSKGG